APQARTSSPAVAHASRLFDRFSFMHPYLVRATTGCALSCLALGSSSAQSTLSSQERSITAAVDKHNAEALALLQRLVDINSGTMNFAGVRQVGDVLRAQFDALGFKTTWIDGKSFERAGHLIAEHPGSGPKLLLIGHLDTVFEPSSPFQKFERID